MKGRFAILGLAFLAGSVATAEIVRYEFSFTADDLMTFVTANGLDGTTAADNQVFDGARLVRQNLTTGYTHSRSYIGSQATDFTNWTNTTSDRLYSFNLWGLDGRGAGWGEDYKPTAWIDHSSSTGWSEALHTWPASWGSPPSGYITDQFIGWNAETFGDALAFSDANNSNVEFSFVVDFDTDDMFWGESTNGAPNTLPQLTFWFGGWMGSGDLNDPVSYTAGDYIYEGNMVLSGTLVPAVVPLPGAAGLGLVGLGLVGVRRRFRKTA